MLLEVYCQDNGHVYAQTFRHDESRRIRHGQLLSLILFSLQFIQKGPLSFSVSQLYAIFSFYYRSFNYPYEHMYLYVDVFSSYV